MFTRNSEINFAPEGNVAKWFLVVYRVWEGATLHMHVHDLDINMYVLPECACLHTEADIALTYSTYTHKVWMCNSLWLHNLTIHLDTWFCAMWGTCLSVNFQCLQLFKFKWRRGSYFLKEAATREPFPLWWFNVAKRAACNLSQCAWGKERMERQ